MHLDQRQEKMKWFQNAGKGPGPSEMGFSFEADVYVRTDQGHPLKLSLRNYCYFCSS